MQTAISHKDNQIFELNEKINQLERSLMDYKELVSEKEDVITSKDMAVQVCIQHSITGSFITGCVVVGVYPHLHACLEVSFYTLK